MAIRTSKTVQNVFGNANLKHVVSITVPSTVNINEADTDLSALWVNKTLTAMSNLFGGATALKGVGGWVSDTQGLVTEDVTKVTSYAKSFRGLTLVLVKDMAESICRAMKQDAVLVEIDGQAFFVSTEH